MANATKILFLAQLPPPFHGQSAVTAAVHEIFSKQGEAHIHHIWHGGANGQTDVGKRSISKYLRFSYMALKLLILFVSGRRYNAAYLGMAPWAHSVTRDAVLMYFAKLLCERVFVHVHGEGLDNFIEPQSLKQKFVARALKSTELIAITEETSAIGQQSGLFAKIREIPNFADDPGEADKKKDSVLRLCTLGNLDARKGIFEFVQTIQHLNERGIDVHGTLIGGGTKDLSVEDMRDHVETLGLSNRINVTGRVSEEEKAQLLSAADIFLYPSRHDLAPLALIEAMAHGCIPIVFSTGGIPGIVGNSLQKNCIETSLDNAAFCLSASELIAGYRADRGKIERDSKAARRRFKETFSRAKFEKSILEMLACDAPRPTQPAEAGKLPAGGQVA